MKETAQQYTKRILSHIDGKDPLKVQKIFPINMAQDSLGVLLCSFLHGSIRPRWNLLANASSNLAQATRLPKNRKLYMCPGTVRWKSFPVAAKLPLTGYSHLPFRIGSRIVVPLHSLIPKGATMSPKSSSAAKAQTELGAMRPKTKTKVAEARDEHHGTQAELI